MIRKTTVLFMALALLGIAYGQLPLAKRSFKDFSDISRRLGINPSPFERFKRNANHLETRHVPPPLPPPPPPAPQPPPPTPKIEIVTVIVSSASFTDYALGASLVFLLSTIF